MDFLQRFVRDRTRDLAGLRYPGFSSGPGETERERIGWTYY